MTTPMQRDELEQDLYEEIDKWSSKYYQLKRQKEDEHDKCEKTIRQLLRRIDKMSEQNFTLTKRIYKKNAEIAKLKKQLKEK